MAQYKTLGFVQLYLVILLNLYVCHVCWFQFNFLNWLSPSSNSSIHADQPIISASSKWLADHIVCLWNAQSLVNQLSAFQSYIIASNYSLVAITETWLNVNILDGEILPGYTICRKDRTSRGSFKLLPLPYNIEAVAVKIVCRRPIIVCVLYILPSANNNYHTQASELFSFSPPDIDLLILSDFNYPDINWDMYSGTTTQSSDFCDLIFELNLSQLVLSATHKAGNILDLVLTNNDELIHDVTIHTVLPDDLSSDHFLIVTGFMKTIPNGTRNEIQFIANY